VSKFILSLLLLILTHLRFKSDLDDFAQKAKLWIWEAKLGRKYAETLRENLSNWFTYTIGYISRCVDIAGQIKTMLEIVPNLPQ
jgi:hypothetical protein